MAALEWVGSSACQGQEYTNANRNRPYSLWIVPKHDGYALENGQEEHIAGPFSTREAAKAAAELMFGGG